MSKFNVGDRVRRTGDSFSGVERGEIYTVSDSHQGSSILKIGDNPYPFDDRFFELVEPSLTIDKVTEWLSENGFGYRITKDESVYSNSAYARNTLMEPEFEWGEEVEVRDDDNQTWKTGIAKFIGINPVTEDYVICSDTGNIMNWSQCRKPKTKVTLDEIAEWKGVDKDRIEIE